MIGKRGDEGMPLGVIMTVVAAAVLLGILFLIIGAKLEGSNGVLQFAQNIFPDFLGKNLPAPSSEGLVAVELTDPSFPLFYYTGTNWQKFQKNANSASVVGLNLSLAETQFALVDLYLKTDRKASDVIPLARSFRQLKIDPLD